MSLPDHRSRPWLLEHAPFLVALLAGLVLRVVVMLAFTPAFVFSDGPMYLGVLSHLAPSPFRPVGYVLLVLLPVSLLGSSVLLVAAVQHLLGLLTAVLVYALLRRWSVGRWVAALACLPVLLDTLQLNLEHDVLSDSTFGFLLVAVVATLFWRRRAGAGRALAAGLLLGVAVTVRVVAEPLVVLLVPACLVLAGPGPVRRVLVALAAVVGFIVPVGAYAAWYHHENGVYALSQLSGRALYMRSTSFVECDEISVPAYQRVLCPREPVGARPDPTYYGFHDPRTLPRLHPPPGTTADQAMHQFAVSAIRAQPLDYLRVVARDFVYNFDVARVDHYGYDTAHKWSFSYFVDYEPTSWTGPAYAAHGGQLQAHQPWADLLVGYQKHGYLPGPALAGCLLLGLLGGLGGTLREGRLRRSGTRTLTLVLTLGGVGLLLAPAVTAEFVWRYQLPALTLLPAAAALGWTALGWAGSGETSPGHRRPEQVAGQPRPEEADRAGTEATASTD